MKNLFVMALFSLFLASCGSTTEEAAAVDAVVTEEVTEEVTTETPTVEEAVVVEETTETAE